MTPKQAPGSKSVRVAAAARQIEIPAELPVLFLVSQVVYPFGATLVQLRAPRNLAVLEVLAEEDSVVAVAFAPGRDAERVTAADLLPIAVAARVIGRLRLPDGSEQVTLQGLTRIHLAQVVQERPYIIARAACLVETVDDPAALEDLIGTVLSRVALLVRLGAPGVEQEHLMVLTANRDDPARFADLVAAMVPLPIADRTAVLEEADVLARLEKVNSLLGEHVAEAQVKAEFDLKVRASIGQSQRKHMLRRHLELIRQELGETSQQEQAAAEALARLEGRSLPAEAEKLVREQAERLRNTNPASAEYAVIQNHVDWLLSMPWGKSCQEKIDLRKVRKKMDADHYGLEEPKERILEHLAVHQLSGAMRSPVLCFVGPPGTGKTSLAQSIAGAIGRRLARISVGGVRDEAEIRGHRRTYVGALPGRLIQALRRSECDNPLLVIDEIDKMGSGPQGDPTAAMLEVLDPEQNSTFRDHYLDVPVDLSRVFFVTTANSWWEIPAPLRDRMERIEIGSYVEEEKIEIARRHLVPRVAERTGFHRRIAFSDAALRALIRGYTREAGVRQLYRSIDAVFRKLAVRLQLHRRPAPRSVSGKLIRKLLGPPDFAATARRKRAAVGLVNGLAWTPVGGDILVIEAVRMPGGGNVQLTGSLGDVMKESVQAALSYVRSRAADLGIPAEDFNQWDAHVHFPEGAVPKDGPSAGVAVTTLLVSLYTGLPIRADVAMTGEVTLRGNILAIGGLREKLAAAARLRIRKVLIPKANEMQLETFRPSILEQLEIVPVACVDDVFEHVFVFPKSTQ